MQMVIKNIHWFLILVAVIVLGVYGLFTFSVGAFKAIKESSTLKTNLKESKSKLELLQKELSESKVEKVEDGKVIFSSQDLGFSPEASFAPLFEIFIDHAKNSGIKIRSIDYNYSPTTDLIMQANLTGYNVCELTITAIGKYVDFQNFFKTIARENFLMSFPEMQIKPWDNDRSILINNFKLRLYTKT